MVRLVSDHGYETSRDYAQLIELMQKTAVVCFIDYGWADGEVTRDVAATVYRAPISWKERNRGDEIFDISCRGTSYCYSFNREMFLECCQKYNVEFIVPVKA